MNLPATALEFLDAFRGAYIGYQYKLPTIHCYCFSAEEDYTADILKRVKAATGSDQIEPTVHEVRDVAPKKRMFCLSFPLPTCIAMNPADPSDHTVHTAPASKKQK
eukprot:GFYU01033136.1.p1 GENE.GFYU01033136.1~~GFYU01033136.1.p1  ORF type:complete len:119 (+),score=20.82 GFYU01033136.1:41-358(+)